MDCVCEWCPALHCEIIYEKIFSFFLYSPRRLFRFRKYCKTVKLGDPETVQSLERSKNSTTLLCTQRKLYGAKGGAWKIGRLALSIKAKGLQRPLTLRREDSNSNYGAIQNLQSFTALIHSSYSRFTYSTMHQFTVFYVVSTSALFFFIKNQLFCVK